MITLYHIETRPDAAPRSRRCPPESFLNTLEAKRYEFCAAKFKEAGMPFIAAMCVRWAAEHRLTIERLQEAERRIAHLDHLLKNGGEA
jgi:hypothetical protein